MTNIPHEPIGELKSVIDTWKAQGRSDEQIHGVLNFVSSGVFQEWLAAHSPSTEEQVDLVQPYKSEKTVTTSSVSSEQYEPTFVSSDELPSTEAAVLDARIDEQERTGRLQYKAGDDDLVFFQHDGSTVIRQESRLKKLRKQRANLDKPTAPLESVTTDEGDV